MASVAMAMYLLAGCMPVTVGPAGPAGPNTPPQIGPTLVLQVTNQSATMLTVGIEFEAQNSSGGGEGGIEACQAMAIGFGGVAGHYRVLVGGDMVREGDVPPRLDRSLFLIVDISIDAAGKVDARPHRISRVEPPTIPRALANCG